MSAVAISLVHWMCTGGMSMSTTTKCAQSKRVFAPMSRPRLTCACPASERDRAEQPLVRRELWRQVAEQGGAAVARHHLLEECRHRRRGAHITARALRSERARPAADDGGRAHRHGVYIHAQPAHRDVERLDVARVLLVVARSPRAVEGRLKAELVQREPCRHRHLRFRREVLVAHMQVRDAHLRLEALEHLQHMVGTAVGAAVVHDGYMVVTRGLHGGYTAAVRWLPCAAP